MKNPIKYICDYFRKVREEERKRSIERMLNHDICVKNDVNDPDNKIYVFVGDIPICLITDKTDTSIENLPENCVNYTNTCDVAEVIANIKKMYRNYLENKPIL